MNSNKMPDIEEIIKKNGGDFFITPGEGGDLMEVMKDLSEFKEKHQGKNFQHFIRENGEGVVVVDNESEKEQMKDLLRKDSIDHLSIEDEKQMEDIKWASYQNKGKDRTGSKKNTAKRMKKNRNKSKAAKMARRKQRGK